MKRFLMFALAAVLGLAAGTADAHGPTRQKLVKTVDIAAPPAKVWAIIADFDKISTWLPPVEKSPATNGNTVGSVRTLTLKGGGEIKEVLDRYSATDMSYTYTIPEVDIKVLPVKDYTATITVKANASGGSTVEWKSAFYRGYMLNDPPPELNDDASRAAVEKVYDVGLANIKALAEKK